MGDETSDHWRDLTNDFGDHRFFHWHSLWYQAKIPIELPDVHSVLEFGPGRGVTKALIEHFGMEHVGVDVSDRLHRPDVTSTILDFETDVTFDLVCSFETLEHNPLEQLGPHLTKMASLTRRYVYLSLPWSGRWFTLATSLSLPKLRRDRTWTVTRPRRRRHVHRNTTAYAADENPYRFHWWEIGDPLIGKREFAAIARDAGLGVDRSWHNPLFPFHWFVLLTRR